MSSEEMNSIIRQAAGRNRLTIHDGPPPSEGAQEMNRRLRGEARPPDYSDPEVAEARVQEILAEREERKRRSRGSADQGPRGTSAPTPDMNQIFRRAAERQKWFQGQGGDGFPW